MTPILPFAPLVLLVPLVAIVAGVYALVGLGGGTGYLAIMTLVGVPAATITSTALLLNIVVTGVALLRFGFAGRLQPRLLLPFLAPAIPAAFLGGLVKADPRMFLGVMAVALAAASIVMFTSAGRTVEVVDRPAPALMYAIAVPSGLVIGFLSGFLGIGGGVFLGPLVLFLGWAGPKSVTAMNSAFVLVLSSVALTAHGLQGDIQPTLALPLALAAVVGGVVGASFSEKKLSPRSIQRVLAVVVLIAAIKGAHDALVH
jgi:uncharacterized protein